MPRTALVTGASGFVGSHLVEELLRRNWRVRVLLRATSSRQWLPVDRIEIVAGDVTDAPSLAAAVPGASAVFHLAAITSATRASDYVRVNVDGTRQLCEAIRARNAGAAVICCSSLAAGGPARSGHPVTEADAPHPITAYGASKLAAEGIIAAAGLRAVIVRPPAVYGPRDHDVLAAFRLATRGLAVRLGPRGQRLSFVHVEDLARGLADAADRGIGRGMYYVSGAVNTWEELVSALGAAVGRRVWPLRVPVTLGRAVAAVGQLVARIDRHKPLLTLDRIRDLTEPDWGCDDTRAREELGYAPRIPLVEGMRATAAWYRAAGWL